MNTPWYYQQEGSTLEHQRNLKEEVRVDGVRTKYSKGFVGRAKKYRDGACENCGSMTHVKRDCFYRPRKKGAKETNADIMPDEVIPEQLELDYAGKRDRWAGYDAASYQTVVDEYEKLDELRRKKKAEQLMAELIEKGSKADEAAETAAKAVANMEDEYVEGEDMDMVGQHFDAKNRQSVRNLRIREDTAKYLYNLDADSAFYDPKSRSMRMDPLPNVPMDEKPFAGDNFVRAAAAGDAKNLDELRQFAWEAQERGMDVDEVGAPSMAMKKFQEYQESTKEKTTSNKDAILAQYGGQEYLKAPERALVETSEVFRVYGRDGRLIQGPEDTIPKSRFLEDELIGNHKSIFGSFWEDFKWGYACCHQFVKNCVCTGIVGQKLHAQGAPMAPPSAAHVVEEVKEPQMVEKKDKKKKKKGKESKKSKKDKKKKDSKRSRSSKTSGEVTAADLEEYKRSRIKNEDPMAKYLSK